MANNKDRMPPLLIDEVLLLVDTYFQLKSVSDSKQKRELIMDLSDSMRALPFYPWLRENPEFRSFAGMQMCLANVGYVDPDNSSTFGHGSKLQKKVFSEYVTDQNLLHNISKAIKRVSKIRFPLDYSFSDCIFGMLLPSYHCYLERTNQTICAVKESLTLQKKNCAVCGCDLFSQYIGFDLLEVHIEGPLYISANSGIISPSTLTPICPTCHKAVHSKLELFETVKLIEMLGRE